MSRHRAHFDVAIDVFQEGPGGRTCSVVVAMTQTADNDGGEAEVVFRDDIRATATTIPAAWARAVEQLRERLGDYLPAET